MRTGEIEIAGADAMERLGIELGRVAFGGLTIGLCGPLGAGKTLLVRGLALGLDIVNPLLVSSPTFVLIQEYRARLTIYHFDVYRLPTPHSFAELGPEEYFADDGAICAIEWADRIEDQLPDSWLRLQISHATDPQGHPSRHIDWAWIGPTMPGADALLDALRSAEARDFN